MAFLDLFKVLYLKDITYNTDEKILIEILKTKVESYGIGPSQKVFPNCKITLTNQRIIISQKMLWKEKYRVHYFVWINNEQELSTLKNGMLELSYSKEESRFDNEEFIIIPKNKIFIKKLTIYNSNADLKHFINLAIKR